MNFSCGIMSIFFVIIFILNRSLGFELVREGPTESDLHLDFYLFMRKSPSGVENALYKVTFKLTWLISKTVTGVKLNHINLFF